MQRQRIITTIKNVAEKTKQNQKLKSLIRFHSANKINYNRLGEKGGGREEKSKRIYRTSQKIRIKMFFLSHCCQSSFPSWESQSTSPPQDALQHCSGLWICCGGSSNMVLLLCFLAPNVHSYQNQCIFFCGSTQCPFIYSIGIESA